MGDLFLKQDIFFIMKPELTYILGAGASYQSIPVVKTFLQRFEQFLDYNDRIVNDIRFEQDKRERFASILRIGNELLQSFKAHQSFDTYFKKLFHLGLTVKILEGKKLLNLYFLWEHLSEVQDEPYIEPFHSQRDIFWKQSIIDKRYDALIAGILKPELGITETYCKVNFITWNYDLNLFASIKNYYSPNSSFAEFIKEISVKENYWIIDNQISVVNLNGYFYSSAIDKFRSFDEHSQESLHEFIYKKIRGNYLSPTINDKDADTIKFAWEQTDELKDIAKQKITNSNNVVVIGYTFPLYNRLTDFEYFNMEYLTEKNVFIQDPRACDMTKSITEDFSLITKTVDYYNPCNLNAITNCDSFIIPSDIFRYKDSLEEI